MLREAGAPAKENDIVSSIILETGTLWHRKVGEILVNAGVPFMQEVRLNQWLPTGWGGTADWVFWHPEYEAFVLGDLKTTAGEGLAHIEREGIKEAHHHQLSAYWYALRAMGLPLVEGFGVLYLPKNRAKNYKTEPVLIEAAPLDETYMLDLMNERRGLVDAYLDTLDVGATHFPELPVNYIQDTLAPRIERVLKVVWNKDVWDVKLVPHWSAQFCPYSEDLCDCSTTGETKVGHYTTFLDDEDVPYVSYVPRRGFDVEPPKLTHSQERRLYESRPSQS